MTDNIPELTGEVDLDHDVAGFDFSWCAPVHRNLLNELVGLEAASIDNDKTGISWNFRPHPLSRIGYLVNAVLMHTDTPFRSLRTLPFLEVGCGIGAKLVMVEKVFGLSTIGIDSNPEYVETTNELLSQYECHWGDAFVEDARAYKGYGAFGIVYLNRPIWVYDIAAALEEYVTEQMHSGAYLILGNAATTPNWPVIATDIAMTVYRKP